VLAEYGGEFTFSPTLAIKITADGRHLYAQATGQPRFELFAEKKDEFFFKEVYGQISFSRDDGKVTQLVLNQNGQYQIASKKIP